MTCKESQDTKNTGKCEKEITGTEKRNILQNPKRYLIGFGVLTKTRKSLYAVHYE